LLALVLVGTLGCFRDKNSVVTPLRASQSVVVDCSVTDIDVVNAVNKYRAEVGVAPLTFREELDEFSNERATGLDGNMDNHVGLRPLLSDKGFMGYQYIGENLQYYGNCSNSASRVYRFKESERHWASLMNERYDEVGVGFYRNVLVVNLGDLQ